MGLAVSLLKEGGSASVHADAERPSLEDLGILFLSGAIDDATARTVCERIIELNVRGEADCVQLVVNSPGGDLHACFAITDLMAWSRLPVHTTGVGLIASAALVVFMAGAPGHRVLTPRTCLLSHSFRAQVAGTRAELLARRKLEDWLHRQLVSHYLRHTALTTEADLAAQLLGEGDFWFTPEEAVALGVADRIHPVLPLLTATQEVV
jgi:ATP-dependent Clp protease protease subunit